jgi:hypothetical protein
MWNIGNDPWFSVLQIAALLKATFMRYFEISSTLSLRIQKIMVPTRISNANNTFSLDCSDIDFYVIAYVETSALDGARV